MKGKQTLKELLKEKFEELSLDLEFDTLNPFFRGYITERNYDTNCLDYWTLDHYRAWFVQYAKDYSNTSLYNMFTFISDGLKFTPKVIKLFTILRPSSDILTQEMLDELNNLPDELTNQIYKLDHDTLRFVYFEYVYILLKNGAISNYPINKHIVLGEDIMPLTAIELLIRRNLPLDFDNIWFTHRVWSVIFLSCESELPRQFKIAKEYMVRIVTLITDNLLDELLPYMNLNILNTPEDFYNLISGYSESICNIYNNLNFEEFLDKTSTYASILFWDIVDPRLEIDD